jgi:hypothetical protein
VRELLLQRGECPLPLDVHVYLFAIQANTMKTTGVSGHIINGKIHVVSEFTFFPLGTVLSWGPLDNPWLTSVRHWAELPFNYKKKIDLEIQVNPCCSPLPIDFRLRSQLLYAATVRRAMPIDYSLLPEMERLVQLRSGNHDAGEYSLTTHPAQAALFKRAARAE